MRAPILTKYFDQRAPTITQSINKPYTDNVVVATLFVGLTSADARYRWFALGRQNKGFCDSAVN